MFCVHLCSIAGRLLHRMTAWLVSWMKIKCKVRCLVSPLSMAGLVVESNSERGVRKARNIAYLTMLNAHFGAQYHLVFEDCNSLVLNLALPSKCFVEVKDSLWLWTRLSRNNL